MPSDQLAPPPINRREDAEQKRQVIYNLTEEILIVSGVNPERARYDAYLARNMHRKAERALVSAFNQEQDVGDAVSMDFESLRTAASKSDMALAGLQTTAWDMLNRKIGSLE